MSYVNKGFFTPKRPSEHASAVERFLAQPAFVEDEQVNRSKGHTFVTNSSTVGDAHERRCAGCSPTAASSVSAP